MTDNDDYDFEEAMDAFYDDCRRANEIKFGTHHGTRMLEAARKGDINAIKQIISLPLHTGGMLLLRLTAKDENENYAHHIAAAQGHKEIVMLLLKNGLSVEVKNSDGLTPSEVAMQAGHHEIADAIQVFKWNKIRNDDFKPNRIRILFVGESPPSPITGKFFYEGGPLTRHMKKAFESQYSSIQQLTDSDFLKCFKKMGCYLDDISLKPVAGMSESDRNYIILSGLNDFIDRLKGYRPNAVVTIIKRIDFFVRYAVEEASLEGVSVDSDYQLTVEDACDVSEHDVVIFADAAVTGKEPFFFEEISSQSPMSISTHSVSPEAVLYFAEKMFDSRAKAYVLGIRGYEFNKYEERLSEGAVKNLEEAFQFVLKIVESVDKMLLKRGWGIV